MAKSLLWEAHLSCSEVSIRGLVICNRLVYQEGVISLWNSPCRQGRILFQSNGLSPLFEIRVRTPGTLCCGQEQVWNSLQLVDLRSCVSGQVKLHFDLFDHVLDCSYLQCLPSFWGGLALVSWSSDRLRKQALVKPAVAIVGQCNRVFCVEWLGKVL